MTAGVQAVAVDYAMNEDTSKGELHLLYWRACGLSRMDSWLVGFGLGFGIPSESVAIDQ